MDDNFHNTTARCPECGSNKLVALFEGDHFKLFCRDCKAVSPAMSIYDCLEEISVPLQECSSKYNRCSNRKK